MNWLFGKQVETTTFDYALTECIKAYPGEAKVVITPWTDKDRPYTMREIIGLEHQRARDKEHQIEASHRLNQHMRHKLALKGFNYDKVVLKCVDRVNNRYYALHDTLMQDIRNIQFPDEPDMQE